MTNPPLRRGFCNRKGFKPMRYRTAIIVTGKAPKPRNPVAASLHTFRTATVKAKRGKGSYARNPRNRKNAD
jgi:hypothetical protein